MSTDRRKTADQIYAIYQAQVHEDQCNCAEYDALTMGGCLFGFRGTASVNVESILDIVAEMIDRHHDTDPHAHEGYDGDGMMHLPQEDEYMTIPDWLRR